MKDSKKKTKLQKLKDSGLVGAIKDIEVTSKNYKEYLKFEEHVFKKGVYDIDYVLSLAKQILNQCEKKILNANEFRFSLQESLKRLISQLEVEKNCKTEVDPMMLFTCPKCHNTDLVRKSNAKEWICPCQFMKKPNIALLQ